MKSVSHGKPCAGNPHARFDEGASASEEPRRKALLHNDYLLQQILEQLQKISAQLTAIQASID